MDGCLCPCMYGIVVSSKARSVLPNALENLRSKYDAKWPGRVSLVDYDSRGGVECCLSALSSLKPSYTCFLVHHSECGREFVKSVNKLTRRLDRSNPFTDTVWGILTGYREDDILLALTREPLTVKRVVGNVPTPLGQFESGVWYSESQPCVSFVKHRECEAAVKEDCQRDTTEELVRQIGDGRDVARERGVDMVITSGHATESELNIAYTFLGGQLRSRGGLLVGRDVDGTEVTVEQSRNAKILSAAGNCLMGHIADGDSMALAWMHTVCVTQMVGYVEPTWFGYGGWGVHKFFMGNPGRMTFAEAFFSNQQCLLHRLHSLYGPHVDAQLEASETVYQSCFNTTASGSKALPRECSGLLYDRDCVAFYGDPAWEVRLAEKPRSHYDYQCSLREIAPPDLDLNGRHCQEEASTSTGSWRWWEYRLTTTRAGTWDHTAPDDKSAALGRCPVFLFPCHWAKVKLVRGGGAVLTTRFLLLPLSGGFDAGEEHVVCFATREQA